jgi:uncharacterized damage-inducible protein DinB
VQNALHYTQVAETSANASRETAMQTPNSNATLRKHLIELLSGGSAHVNPPNVFAGWPEEARGRKPEGAAHTPWEVLEHIRIAQRDILDFSMGGDYEELNWPADYWPAVSGPPSASAWDESVAAVKVDLAALKALVEDPRSDLFTPFPWGDGQTLLREALLVADHNAYHLGEMMVLKRMLGVLEA